MSPTLQLGLERVRRIHMKVFFVIALFALLGACVPSATDVARANPTDTPAPTSTGGVTPPQQTPTASSILTPVPSTRTVLPRTNSPTALPSFSHLFVIIFENHEYTSIAGNTNAPYFNSLAAQYGLATRFYAATHPSLPNYIALTAGSNYGITSDCTDCYLNVANLADQIEASGRTWRAYYESMSTSCYTGSSSSNAGGTYAQKHDPFIYFDDIRNNSTRCANIVPLTNLDADLASGAYNLMWITPNMCNSMHDCNVATGDAWLKNIAPKILNSAAFRDNGALFVTFDEGSTNNGCCTHAAGGRVFTIVAGPRAKRGFQSAQPYDHYSLLATIEDAWGMPRLQNAACACSPNLSEFFTPDALFIPTLFNHALD